MALRDEAKPLAQEPAWARGGGGAERVQERAPEPPSGAARDSDDLGKRELGVSEEQEKAKATPPTEAPLAKSDAPLEDAMNAGAGRAARGSGAATNGDGLAVAGAGTNMLEGRSGFGGSLANDPQDNDAYDGYTTKQSASSGVWAENNDPAIGAQGQPADALPAAAEQRYTSGMSRYNRGDFAGAVEDFNAFIREAPRSSDYYALALYHRGRSEMNQGNPRAAASSFRKVLQEFPDSGKQPEARYWLAKSLLQLNPQDEEGLAILDELSQGNSSVAADARRDSQAYGRRDAERRAKPSKESNAPTKKAKNYDQKDERYEPAEQKQSVE
jgi:TolA-binding protein